MNVALNGQLVPALPYDLMLLIIWSEAARRVVDSHTFTRIYMELAMSVILNQQIKGMDTSTTTARVALSREFVNFFEHHLPTLITSAFSIIGAVLMLLLIKFWSGGIADCGGLWLAVAALCESQ